jgi:hypothetical protein
MSVNLNQKLENLGQRKSIKLTHPIGNPHPQEVVPKVRDYHPSQKDKTMIQ